MAHAMYITDALVCGSKHHNTADKNYLLFTRDQGMLWATARSVREERSKQRYALQDFSYIRVSLVKGKSGWRIGSTEAIDNPFLRAVGRRARGGVTHLIKMLRRYVQGEEPIPLLFDDLAVAVAAIAVLDDLPLITAWQNVALLRLFYALGYVAISDELAPVIMAPSVAAARHCYVDTMDTLIDRVIAQAGEVSHL
jgi:recombinational DNA repair protein (RecF pathway)